eukprot:9365623-Ditylum_brightwellii.AAC.1
MMIAPTRTRNGIKCLLKARSIFAITEHSMMKRSSSGSAPLAPLGAMMIIEAILPKIMTLGKRHEREGRELPTLTPTGAAGTATATLQLLMSPSLKIRIIPQRRTRRIMMPLLNSLLFLVAIGSG